jgi:hypothetical protein|eukprot:Transcript_24278.p1 GENE.Transcript_24278~~Transcript_24278.p1  ORF type:complete len:215 (+),score=37.33 Transcript_24278:165-809(+)
MHIPMEQLVPCLGVVLANVKCASPLQAVLNVQKNRNLGGLNPVPLLAVTANNAGFASYSAFATHDPYVLAATVPGLLAGLFYVGVTHQYAAQHEQLLLRRLGSGYAVVLVLAALACASPAMCSSDILGPLAMTSLLLWYSSSLPALVEAFRGRTTPRIHAPLAATTLCNAMLWLTYGLAESDAYVCTAQAYGVLMALAQLVMLRALSSAQEATA